MNYQGKKFLSLPEQVQVNKRNIEQLKRDEYRTFTTQLAIENLTYLELNQLVENSRDVSVGDLIYGSDAYYGQITRVGGSVVEFTTVGLMPAGPKGDKGDQGPIGLQGPQGIQGIPGEVQIKDMPGVNLTMPDLSTATDLGDGNYRFYNANGITLDYNVNNGIYTRSGTTTDSVFMRLSERIVGYHNQIMTMKVIRVLGSGEVYPFIGTGSNFGANMTINMNEATVTKLLNNPNDEQIGLYNNTGVSANVQFKLQLEKGDTASPYTVPGQIPQYALKEQETWITPTMVNGFSSYSNNTMQYMKDTLGFVHIEGSLTGGTPGLPAFTLPTGYRPKGRIIVRTLDNAYTSKDITINEISGQVTGFGYLSISFKAV